MGFQDVRSRASATSSASVSKHEGLSSNNSNQIDPVRQIIGRRHGAGWKMLDEHGGALLQGGDEAICDRSSRICPISAVDCAAPDPLIDLIGDAAIGDDAGIMFAERDEDQNPGAIGFGAIRRGSRIVPSRRDARRRAARASAPKADVRLHGENNVEAEEQKKLDKQNALDRQVVRRTRTQGAIKASSADQASG